MHCPAGCRAEIDSQDRRLFAMTRPQTGAAGVAERVVTRKAHKKWAFGFGRIVSTIAESSAQEKSTNRSKGT